ncbi:GntR family transcriptional regulator [Sandaracinomonas limnophila]|uniref:GntR family transcriptional regulator n=1 Tax=Sandaracinomonas limnophila TaxID=1862386 RepID=A0A437PX13_9BACT|nr:GntR family transcriptional regulator [Sandaracinomonas limnophila]RVU26807.1 GntR family transcriptional regulator [Sandaracinomonas limnophila]
MDNHIVSVISLDEFSSTPKYRQLADSIIDGIRNKSIKKGDVLPSINELSFELFVSRITIEKGYNYLKSKGIIDSVRGKGFFIKVDKISDDYRIFLLFNKLSGHKKIIYDSFVQAMGEGASIDFYVYNNDYNLFKRIIESRDRDYSHIVIIPHFLESDDIAFQLINNLPKEKLILMDKLPAGIDGDFGAVFENFEKDIYKALLEIKESLTKYQVLKMIFPNTSYYPHEIVEGFTNFCKDFAFDMEILNSSKDIKIRKGDAFITVMEDDLIPILENVLEQNFQLGKDVGLISYNETPIKRLLFSGISTISTDFELMGQTAADLIKSNSKQQIENPFNLIIRSSI